MDRLAVYARIVGISAATIALILLFGSAHLGAGPPAAGRKVAVVSFQEAIAQTQEGKERIATFQDAVARRQEALKKLQAELDAVRTRLAQAGSLLNASAYNQLLREARQKAVRLQRATEDASDHFTQAQQEILQSVGRPMLEVIAAYAGEHGYNLVLDVSTARSPVIWFAGAINITSEIAREYDKVHSPPPARTSSK